MGFINSPLLWGGFAAAGIALPIIIHLLRKFQVIRWGAMALLQRVLQKHKRRVQTEDLIVLILRCVALALLALALLRPTILSRAGAFLMGDQRVGIVMAVDASYSMGHGEIRSRFRDACEAAKSVLSTMKSGDRLTLVLLGQNVRLLLRKAGYDAQRVEEILAEASYLPEPLNPDVCFEQLQELMAELDTPLRECYIVSDAQVTTWKSLSDKTRSVLNASSQSGEGSRTLLIRVEPAHSENLAITRLEFAGGALRTNGSARYVVEIANHGAQPRPQVPIQFDLNGQTLDTQTVPLVRPGERQVVSFDIPFDRAGQHRLKATIGSDAALLTDNERFAVAEISESTRVLCVDGGDVEQTIQSDSFFLQKAIRLKGGAISAGLQLSTLSESAFLDYELESDGIIILANIHQLPNETARAIRKAVRRGANLILFPGDRTDLGQINLALGTEEGLLPAEMLEPEFLNEEDGLTLDISTGHPLAMAIQRLPQELAMSVRFWGHIKMRLLPEARTVLKLSDGTPLLVEKKVGTGRVMLFASSIDRLWNDLAISPLYPIWIHQLLSYMSSSDASTFLVGKRIRLPFEQESLQAIRRLETPSGETRIGKIERDAARAHIDFGHANSPGFYEAESIGQSETSFAANVEPLEADVKTLDIESLKEALNGTGLAVLPTTRGIGQAVRQQRIGYEIWKTLLILGLTAFIAQAWLSDHFSKRMTARQDKGTPAFLHSHTSPPQTPARSA
ncbi:MAG: BatA domain-containing protein [Planctomycetota bacterium]|nr:BatA domain-containing protein [Planctomycetota bacterium]